jgi:hypothetical protein
MHNGFSSVFLESRSYRPYFCSAAKQRMKDMSHAIAQNTSILNHIDSTAITLWNTFVEKMVLSTKPAQIVQLTQAMNRMSDAQLAQIGITRSEIADYANMSIRLDG